MKYNAIKQTAVAASLAFASLVCTYTAMPSGRCHVCCGPEDDTVRACKVESKCAEKPAPKSPFGGPQDDASSAEGAEFDSI